MKRTTILLVLGLIFTSSLFSQLSNNLISPIGKIGIGTLFPSYKLHVVGNSFCDSTFTTRKFKVIQTADFLGNTTFQRRLYILGKCTIDSTVLNGPVYVPQMGMLPDNVDIQEFFVRDPISGKMLRGTMDQLKSGVYKDPTYIPCRDDNGGYTTPASPIWVSKPGVLHTSIHCSPDVKVGIGLGCGGLNCLDAKLQIQMASNTIFPNTKAILVKDATGRKIFQLNYDGLMYAREIKVNLDASWPDYVFSPDYQLMPLNELDQYVKNNGHLPGMPDACSIEGDGIPIGTTTTVLVEKVEELTLYMIQLQETLKQQQELLQSQQEVIRLQQEQLELLKTKLN